MKRRNTLLFAAMLLTLSACSGNTSKEADKKQEAAASVSEKQQISIAEKASQEKPSAQSKTTAQESVDKKNWELLDATGTISIGNFSFDLPQDWIIGKSTQAETYYLFPTNGTDNFCAISSQEDEKPIDNMIFIAKLAGYSTALENSGYGRMAKTQIVDVDGIKIYGDLFGQRKEDKNIYVYTACMYHEKQFLAILMYDKNSDSQEALKTYTALLKSLKLKAE